MRNQDVIEDKRTGNEEAVTFRNHFCATSERSIQKCVTKLRGKSSTACNPHNWKIHRKIQDDLCGASIYVNNPSITRFAAKLQKRKSSPDRARPRRRELICAGSPSVLAICVRQRRSHVGGHVGNSWARITGVVRQWDTK